MVARTLIEVFLFLNFNLIPKKRYLRFFLMYNKKNSFERLHVFYKRINASSNIMSYDQIAPPHTYTYLVTKETNFLGPIAGFVFNFKTSYWIAMFWFNVFLISSLFFSIFCVLYLKTQCFLRDDVTYRYQWGCSVLFFFKYDHYSPSILFFAARFIVILYLMNIQFVRLVGNSTDVKLRCLSEF